MSDHCRWVSSTEPRVLPGRHRETCVDEGCRGCQPCGDHHCRECGVTHVSGVEACACCLEDARSTLDEIRRLTEALPEEAELRGVDGEAFNLLGPAADPEARGHLEASVKAGRVPPEYLEVADNERHPLFVAATWASVYREAFDHDEPSGRVELADELGYLGRNLTYAAGFEHVPWEEFARDLRGCLTHLESVLGDSSRGERTNIDCLDCGSRLERRLGAKGFEDVATCLGCKRRYTGPEYNFAVRNHYIQNAQWLSDKDMTIRTGVLSDTVRSWARTPKDGSAPLIAKDVQLGRVVFLVADVERVAVDKGLASCA